MDDNFRHCEQLVREGDKDRFLAALFAPADKRGALFALYAFNLEVARVREAVREAMAGEIRLQWWRDAIESGGGEASAHPVAAALRETIARFDLPVAPLIDLIEARSFDLYDDPMPNSAALEGYAVKTSSALIGLAASILEQRQPIPAERLTAIKAPTLIPVGTRDMVAGSAHELAALIPGAVAFDIPNRDHMLATGDKAYKAAVLDFLAKRP